VKHSEAKAEVGPPSGCTQDITHITEGTPSRQSQRPECWFIVDAGFQVTMYGRFWVITEALNDENKVVLTDGKDPELDEEAASELLAERVLFPPPTQQ